MTPGIVAESDLNGVTQSEYVFFNGNRVARRDFGPTGPTGVFYYFSDHLKTASVITDATGTIKAESDYYPWGRELQFVANDSNHYKFTGKERDTETGLDYFGARYYSSGLGRFITPDWAAKPSAVPYAVLGDPQSLHLYTYVRNVPTSALDPDGHCPIPSLGMDCHFSTPWRNFLDTTEAGFFFRHPIMGHRIGTVQHGATNISTNATRFSTGLGLSENASHAGSQVNATRHTLWQATITSKYNAAIAREVGDAHESNPNKDLSVRSFTGKDALAQADQSVDLLNNQIGRSIGDANPGASMQQLAGTVLDYYHDNGLYTAQQNADGSVSIVQTKLSDEQYAQAREQLGKMDANGYKPEDKKKE